MNLHLAEPTEYRAIDEIAHESGLTIEWSSKAALDAGVTFIVGEGGFVIVRERGNGLAEVDVVIAPAWRGAWAVNAARAVITAIFNSCDVTELVGKTPVENKEAMAFARMIGFKCYADGEWTTRLARKDWKWGQG